MSTRIEWAGRTIGSPGIFGCKHASAACENCYAEIMAQRQVNMGHYPAEVVEDWRWTGKVVTDEDECKRRFAQLPKHPRIDRHVFVGSMTDILHMDVPTAHLLVLLRECEIRPEYTFLLLSKRPWRYPLLASTWTRIQGRPWPVNVWSGATIEDAEQARIRIPFLLETPGRHFVSMEPLLGSVDLTSIELDGAWLHPLSHAISVDGRGVAPHGGIDWVIVGGESGPKARPTDPRWVSNLRDQCLDERVPFLFKSWGTWRPTSKAEIVRNRWSKDVLHVHEREPLVASVRTRGREAAHAEIDGRTWRQVPDFDRLRVGG